MVGIKSGTSTGHYNIGVVKKGFYYKATYALGQNGYYFLSSR